MQRDTREQTQVSAIAQPRGQGFIDWLQDPMGAIIASSVAVIGSFGIVISGSWFIHTILN